MRDYMLFGGKLFESNVRIQKLALSELCTRMQKLFLENSHVYKF